MDLIFKLDTLSEINVVAWANRWNRRYREFYHTIAMY